MIIKFIFLFIIFIHSLLHLVGFFKEFGIGNFNQINKIISKPIGILWLIAAIIFLITALLILLKNNIWFLTGLISILISQILIISYWQDAKYGTIANLIILIGLILNYGSYKFERGYISDVKSLINLTTIDTNDILAEKDIQHLPEIVRKYLYFTNVVNKPKVQNYKAVLKGKMRSKGRDFFEFTSEQYNFTQNPARLFFMKGKIFGLTVPGYHKYFQSKASMDIKLFGLFSLIKAEGEVMDKAETVTLFNDMCLLAPATLINKNITWEQVNDTTIIAFFLNNGIRISATLIFENNGKLINFISLDRTDINDMKQYPFSTPIYEYKNINGINVVSKANAVWKYPEGEFTYGIFELIELEYNLPVIK